MTDDTSAKQPAGTSTILLRISSPFGSTIIGDLPRKPLADMLTYGWGFDL
jgi:hypothetical protein